MRGLACCIMSPYLFCSCPTPLEFVFHYVRLVKLMKKLYEKGMPQLPSSFRLVSAGSL